MDKIKIIIVDDHPMVLEGMKSLMAQINFINLIGLASNAYQTMELLKTNITDVVITDINLPEISGIELTAKIKKEFPGVRVIAMSTFKERSYISQMIQNGASGYLVKSASKEEIEEAILCVYEGKLYMSLEINFSSADKQEINSIPVLSSREKEVLLLIADGFTNPQIASKLFISLHTVDSHRKNLLTKFAVNNTASLIKLAAKYSLV
jgi:DNA-binding NarL/FixJ family response regulator